jgi:hypothetical protein
MKLICRRTTFIPGFCVFLLQHKVFGVSPTDPQRLHSATSRYWERLNEQAVGFQDAAAFFEHVVGIIDMLDDLAGVDDVEGLVVVRDALFQVAVTELVGQLGGFLEVVLRIVDAVALVEAIQGLVDLLDEEAVAAADI